MQFVTGARETGSLLASHMDIAKISFTGSIAGGKAVQEAATRSNLKKVTLELGGKSAALVFDDANFDQTVDGYALLRLIFAKILKTGLTNASLFSLSHFRVATAFLANSGQICVGMSCWRVLEAHTV